MVGSDSQTVLKLNKAAESHCQLVFRKTLTISYRYLPEKLVSKSNILSRTNIKALKTFYCIRVNLLKNCMHV